MISGLKLEGEIKELQTSMQYREKVRAPLKGNVLIEASVIGNMQAWNIQPNKSTLDLNHPSLVFDQLFIYRRRYCRCWRGGISRLWCE